MKDEGMMVTTGLGTAVITGIPVKTGAFRKKNLAENASVTKKKKAAPAEKVILVEKDQATRSSMARVLLKMRYRVDCFADFGEAIANSQGVKARLVIISIHQNELLDMILSQFPPDTGVLILADASDLAAVAQSRCCAIRSFLVRPFTSRQLSDCVLRTIEGVNQISESIKSSALAEIDEKQVAWPRSEDSFQQLLYMLTARTDAVYALRIAQGHRKRRIFRQG